MSEQLQYIGLPADYKITLCLTDYNPRDIKKNFAKSFSTTRAKRIIYRVFTTQNSAASLEALIINNTYSQHS